MGTRLYKVIGYGLVDVINDSGNITDPRINMNSIAFDEDAAPTLLDYRNHLEGIIAQSRGLRGAAALERSKSLLELLSLRDLDASDLSCKDPLDSLHFGTTDYGLGNVFLISPFAFKDWQRVGDIMDALECEPLLDVDGVVRVLNNGIYPFNVEYMDIRTGDRLSSEILEWVRSRSRLLKTPEDTQAKRFADILAQELGFANHAEADKYVAPCIPAPITNFARWCNLFTSEEVLLELRPMILQYWR